ncbi:MAG: CBS domain-containing protein [Candidatus Binatia bacterium]
MKVINVMTTDPVSVEPSDTILQAQEIMRERDIRQLPVIKGKELIGIITDRDIRSFLGSNSFNALEDQERAGITKVAAVMTNKPIFLSPDDDLRDAVELLIEEKVGGIPVVDEEEGLVGIVTYLDLLQCFLEHLEET